MNEYTLVPTLKGIEVFNNEEKYFVALKMFSLSATMFDSNGAQIASMKRSSWWRMNFKIEAENEIYNYTSSALNGTLVATNANQKYVTNGSTDFYELNGRRITELTRKKSPLGSLSLKININEHHQALINLSCMYYKTVIAAPGYA